MSNGTIEGPDHAHWHVRPIVWSDGTPLGALFERLSPAARRDFHPHPLDRPTAEEIAAGRVIDGPVWVAVAEPCEKENPCPAEQIPGYAFLARWTSPPPVLGLAVDPSYQRRGIGRALCAAALSEAENAGMRGVSLTVYADNIGALRLYESLGFQVTRQLLYMERHFGSGALHAIRSRVGD